MASASDHLNNQASTQQQLYDNSKYWVYGGDAPAENATCSYCEDPQGRYIGVQAPSNGTRAGFYAATPSANAQLFHAVLASPPDPIPYGESEWVVCADDTGARKPLRKRPLQ